MFSTGHATGIKSGILQEAYHRLTSDQSAASNLTEEEIDIKQIQRLLENEDPDLIWDLHLTNSGHSEEYHVFLEKCQEFVLGKIETAVDDR